MEKEKTMQRNEVKTVFSKNSVSQLECLIHWFWNEFPQDGMTKDLMEILEVYVEAKPQIPYRTPQSVVGIISNIIQLQERLMDIARSEKPYHWDCSEAY